jgi:hypothetical protein
MMVSTHLLAGLSLGLLPGLLFGETSGVIYFSIIIGSFFPDLDILFDHRNTFHRPFEYGLAVLIIGSIYLITNSVFLVAILGFFVSMLVHCFMDLISTENRDRALYDHIYHRWIDVKNIIPTRSLRDFLISLLFSTIPFYYMDVRFYPLILVLLGYSFLYAVFRERIEDKVLGDYSSYTERVHQVVI